MPDYQEVHTVEHEQGVEQRVASYKAAQLIWLLLGILEALIALRVVFKLIGVNASNSFAALLYNITNIFVAPFASLTGTPQTNGMVLEISSIIAMVIYLLIAWALVQIVKLLFYRPRGPVSTRQTVVSDHTTPLVNQSVTTDRVITQAPINERQTVITERTNSQNPPHTL